ncbi:hypothetical protein B0H17DRAFT_1078206 [Mycena rosella]|uniref:Uncharacterized protein n=1 Tax=Mycena rosella TaxID=1033263 RepID=A0AAD7D4N3_MYCRO|nr:hypothetical protein B0H17DRAFT_1078206 [Mycena rosella]
MVLALCLRRPRPRPRLHLARLRCQPVAIRTAVMTTSTVAPQHLRLHPAPRVIAVTTRAPLHLLHLRLAPRHPVGWRAQSRKRLGPSGRRKSSLCRRRLKIQGAPPEHAKAPRLVLFNQEAAEEREKSAKAAASRPKVKPGYSYVPKSPVKSKRYLSHCPYCAWIMTFTTGLKTLINGWFNEVRRHGLTRFNTAGLSEGVWSNAETVSLSEEV